MSDNAETTIILFENVCVNSKCSRTFHTYDNAETTIILFENVCVNSKCSRTFHTYDKERKTCSQGCARVVSSLASKKKKVQPVPTTLSEEQIETERSKDNCDCIDYPKCLTLSAKTNSIKVGCETCSKYKKQPYYFVKPEDEYHHISDIDF